MAGRRRTGVKGVESRDNLVTTMIY